MITNFATMLRGHAELLVPASPWAHSKLEPSSTLEPIRSRLTVSLLCTKSAVLLLSCCANVGVQSNIPNDFEFTQLPGGKVYKKTDSTGCHPIIPTCTLT